MNIYGFLIGLGVVIIMYSVEKVFRDKIKFYDYLIAGAITLFFARLAFIIHHTPMLLKDFTLFFRVYEGGVSILGAIIGMALSGFLVAKRRNINFLKLSDTIFLNLPLVQAIGRIGNFFNQEVYGYPTNLPWAIHIEKHKRLLGWEEFDRFHPIFAYELILNLLNWIFLIYIYKKFKLKKGLITSFFIFNYGIIRLVVNRFRLEKGYILEIETADLFSSVLIILGSILILHMIGSKKIQKKIARVVSKILNPFLLTPIPFFVIAFKQELFKIEPLHITIIMIIGILGPLLQFFIFKKLNLINDWDISDRTKRPLYTFIAGSIFLILFLISLLSVCVEIKIITLSLTIITYLFALISTKWKISGHLAFLSFTITTLYLLTSSPIFIFVFPPLLILVSWSRMILGHHDLLQTIMGTLLSILITIFIWYLATQQIIFS